MRETTISVSYEEKNRLENFKTELFNSKEVSYGAVLVELMDRVEDTKE